jgi:hypothetical protein
LPNCKVMHPFMLADGRAVGRYQLSGRIR